MGEGQDAARGTGRADPALSFGGVADAYERGRPPYPSEAAAWLVGEENCRVLELGAGTGKLTRELVALGHEVLATDPDRAMLSLLADALPDVRTAVASAEDLGVLELPDQSIDVVVAAQCFHWFDLDRALPEIARVLRPGGHLALVWNERDDRVPWVKKLGRLIGSPDQLRDPTDALLGSELFTDVEVREVKHRQHLDQHTVQDLALSRSTVATLDEAARERVLADVRALYDDYGRGMDGMLLPYFTRCFRAEVVELVFEKPEPAAAEHALPAADEASAAIDPMTDTIPRSLRGRVRPARAGDLPPSMTGAVDADDQMLLIDFR